MLTSLLRTIVELGKHQLRTCPRGHLSLSTYYDFSSGCMECDAQAYTAAETGAIGVADMVRHVPDDVFRVVPGLGVTIWRRLDRSRAIELVNSYTRRHHEHAATRGAYAHGPSTLADTQELEVPRC